MSPNRNLVAALGLVLGVGSSLAATPPVEAPAASLRVEGSALVLTQPDGAVLRGADLTGAVLLLAVEGGAVAPVKLAAIAPDPKAPQILRHDFQVADGQGGWQPACTPNAQGERWGFPVSLPVGHPGREGAITISCASGAVVKCARFGYPSWGTAPGGESLLPLHAACVRMVRADYCGDGKAHTKDGTTIDYYDDLGIEKSASPDGEGYAFEAGWAPEGAVCVAHPRWSDLATLDGLKRDCPRLAALPTCTETSARAAGARLFNKSRRLGAATAAAPAGNAPATATTPR